MSLLFVMEVDVRSLLALSALLLLPGCHCWGWGEQYSDVIDCIADRPLMLDHLYCEGLDVTRICIADCDACGSGECGSGSCASQCECAQCNDGCTMSGR